MLSRALAERGHYPAIDIGQSISRCMSLVAEPAHSAAARSMKALLSSYQQVRDLLPMGAYVPGADPQADRAVSLYPRIEAYLHQGVKESAPLTDCLRDLSELMA